ncbi:MAG TPA: cysteine peptidase family C39 domain-containing protein, partial [Phyllobacterium sp.]|nr:cysteine peptidase family C39 domain-containing protein [Phyllobacterium sp.]
YARKSGLAARCSQSAWTKLAGDQLPAIATLRNGSFLLLGKVNGDTILVLAPRAERPTLMTRAEFEAIWDGRLIVMKKRSAFATQLEHFFMTAITRLQRL